MPPFEKPKFSYEYDVQVEVDALRHYRDTATGRSIPTKAPNRLLIATWNIANLGAQERRNSDYQIIAELMSWFDIIAVQEVNDNLSGLNGIRPHMPPSFRFLFSDMGGNKERLAFIYDTDKITLLEKVGEIAYPPVDLRHIKLPGIEQKFDGFDRNPYLAAFQANNFRFLLVNVHLYFGSESKKSLNRRSLETYAVARWADLRRKSRNVFAKDIIAIGDFNLPKVSEDDPIYKALTRRGLHLPKHSTEIGSSIKTDSHYDQIAFFPGETGADFTERSGVFDFDGVVFRSLWDRLPENDKSDFFAYLRYYLSDHRILWAEFKTEA